ncbi:MAG: helix-turn-helix transcriptional regulator [Humibacillus sp.]|nr:helix-turn-helix transcriptional regulator [Humibacillus sp.]MDN5775496.1 helix-turn-helix transcriptional regulator [Humibacillus sp.]
MSTSDRLRNRLESLIDEAGFNRSQAAYAIGKTPSRLGDYLAGRIVPSATVLLDLEDAADQAARRTWMRAADVVEAVAEHADTDPIAALTLLLQGRDQSLALSSTARQAIWATGSAARRLTGPWKVLTYVTLRDSTHTHQGRPVPRWLADPTPLHDSWEPLPVRADRPVHEGLARFGIRINTRELVTA